MKKITLILGMVLLSIASFGQNDDLKVVSPAGGYFTGSGITLSWTLGEPVIATFSAGDILLTQGFQQGDFWSPPQSHTLILLANPDNIGAELIGAGEHEEGSLVNISAGNVLGYSFIGWSGNEEDTELLEDADEPITSFTMPSRDVTFTANYQAVDYNVSVTVVPASAGTITGDGVYHVGDEVTLTATASDGYEFLNWRIDGSVVSSDNPFTFTMPAADVQLTAHFKEAGIETYTLTLAALPADGGTVVGGGEYEEGDVVTVAAIANSGYVFVNWTNETNDVVSTTASFNYTMPAADVTLTANFEAVVPTYTLTLVANPVAGGTVTGAGVYEEGDEVAITATANNGYEFVNWTDASNEVVSTAANFSFTMPAANVTLTANFNQTAPYVLTLIANPADGGVVSGAGAFEAGDEVAVSATANSGYEFVNWTNESDEVISTTASFNYTMPAANVTLTANFEALPTYYTVTFTVTNIKDNEPIANVVITINDDITATTNAEGIATVELLDGAYSYSANAGETFTVETGEFVVDGADLNINVRMNPVGVPANILSMLEAYPNPFSSHVTIKNADWVTRVVFTNIIGQKVADVTLPGVDVFTIYTNQLEKGIYLVIFQGNNGEKVIRKMVKE
ncbi:MAG TPA: InlB B-repeat-containing protein [Tenuifilaceae bacterium]|nr:InlB B-repeat-containing protein [Tenuifilaceae bacterium]